MPGDSAPGEQTNPQSGGAQASPEGSLRAIRRFCLACGGNRTDVRSCDAKDACPLWSYRFGVLPSTFKRVVARRRRSRTELALPGFSK